MSKLLVLTFADKALNEHNHLRRSCEQFGIPWKAVISSPWKENVLRLKLLYEFVRDQNPELVLLVADAYDAALYDSAEAILKIFFDQNTDIMLSGESNFTFRDSGEWLSFLRRYPPQPTIYQYVNAGTYIGRARHLLELLEAMQNELGINFLDEEELLPIKSDQYLLSKFFVKTQYKQAALKLSVDKNQVLFGCTGGRFCVLNFPDISKWQSFINFILERNLLKAFKLHQHQKRPKDFTFQNEQFYNAKTKTYPPVMHFPGTQNRFNSVLEELSKVKPTFSKKGTWIFAAGISCFAFIISLFAGPVFWVVNRRLP